MALLPEHLRLLVRKHLEGSAFERRWGRCIISKINMQNMVARFHPEVVLVNFIL